MSALRLEEAGEEIFHFRLGERWRRFDGRQNQQRRRTPLLRRRLPLALNFRWDGLPPAKNRRGRIVPPRRWHFDRAYDLWQHLAQPAASVQHLAQVVASLQQLPSQAMAGLALAFLQQVEQPVVIRIPAAKTAARIIIDFILFLFGCLWTR